MSTVQSVASKYSPLKQQISSFRADARNPVPEVISVRSWFPQDSLPCRGHMIESLEKVVSQKMKNDSHFSRVRIIVALASVAAAVGLGILTPDPTPGAASNAIIGGFTVALMMAMATVFAMIPGPPDPRKLLLSRALRRGNQPEDSVEPGRREAEKFTGFGHPVFTRPLPATDDTASKS